jgi:VIT1/CCC1 family predicted Fe2+/Mn2+ transporter
MSMTFEVDIGIAMSRIPPCWIFGARSVRPCFGGGAFVWRFAMLTPLTTTETPALGVPRVSPEMVNGSDGAARTDAVPVADLVDEHEAIGTAFGAAGASFCFFASGAIIPVLPYLFGLGGLRAVLVATFFVGIALLCTGAAVGVLSGGPPVRRALRQLAIGFGAAATTYVLGLLFGASV